MYDLLYDPPTKLMMLGGCSIVSSTIGEAAKMWNLVVVRYGNVCATSHKQDIITNAKPRYPQMAKFSKAKFLFLSSLD